MKTAKRILSLALFFGLSLALAGCEEVDTSKPLPAGYTTQAIEVMDDFSNKDLGWPHNSQSTGDYSGYYDGYYEMQLASGTTTYLALPYKNTMYENYTIKVSVKISSNDAGAFGGLYFNDNSKDNSVNRHHVFAISTDKYVVANGATFEGMDITNQMQSTEIIHEGKLNTLRVEVNKVAVDKSVVKLFINDTPVKSIDVPLHFDGETVGLYFSNSLNRPVKIQFDNFYIKGTALVKK